jgi:hypothetical protein
LGTSLATGPRFVTQGARIVVVAGATSRRMIMIDRFTSSRM